MPVPQNLSSSTNSILSENADVNSTDKYSMQGFNNNTWRSYLDKNYKNRGTGETIKEVKIAETAKNSNSYTEKQNEMNKKYTRKEEKDRLFKEMKILPEDLNMGEDIKFYQNSPFCICNCS